MKLLGEKVFVDDEAFCVFLKRFNERKSSNKLELISLPVDQMYGLYDAAIGVYGHLFFSRLEDVINRLEGLTRFVISLTPNKKDLSEEEVEEFFCSFAKDQKNFEKMKIYIVSSINSLSIDSIDALYPKCSDYHNIQELLFTRLPFYLGHQECSKIHNNMIRNFYLGFHLELFNGKTFNKNDDFKLEVFSPVIKKTFKIIDDRINFYVNETNTDKQYLLRDINSI